MPRRRRVCRSSLEKMDATVPWDFFLALIQPVDYKPTPKGGRAPFSLEDMLIATSCFRCFAGIDMIGGRIPDETTILNFRHLLEEHQIAEQIFEKVNQSLSEKGIMLKEVTLLDATIINAPNSTKNKNGERDPKMHSLAKGNQWFFGMQCHIGVDAVSAVSRQVPWPFGVKQVGR